MYPAGKGGIRIRGRQRAMTDTKSAKLTLQTAQYIRDLTLELAAVADKNQLQALAYILKMAAEAALPPECSD